MCKTKFGSGGSDSYPRFRDHEIPACLAPYGNGTVPASRGRMDPALASASSPVPVAFEDGLGTRRLAIDRARNETVEMLCLRGELTAVPSFEFALRERLGNLAAFSH